MEVHSDYMDFSPSEGMFVPRRTVTAQNFCYV